MKNIAIIGMGPRGLYALEQLLLQLEKVKKIINISVFEPFTYPGSGWVWDMDQADCNWINITERALKDLSERPEIKYNNLIFERFPSYHEWANYTQNEIDPDTFPPRKKIGRYLKERFLSIHNTITKCKNFNFNNSRANSLILKDNTYHILDEDQNLFIFDEILLCIGHQPTKLSTQLKDWKKYVRQSDSICLFEDPYPVSQFDSLKNLKNINVGIRGFGLAMIDVMRAITTNNFGNFEVIDSETFKTKYVKNEEQYLNIIPFSIDGLPLAPKPLNENIDNWFKPTADELDSFKDHIRLVTENGIEVENIEFLTSPICKIISRVYLDLENRFVNSKTNKKYIEETTKSYLDDNSFKNPLLQNEKTLTKTLIESYISMALGKTAISLDYCIWQVWRHCQPTMYLEFSHENIDEDIMNLIIALDERSKRFSYGPPIESMQQILALTNSGILNLDYVNDPEIETGNKSWNLTNSKYETISCSIMINSVLDAPKLLEVNSPIIKQLLNDDVLKPVHSELGIHTSKDGYILTPEGNKDVSIAVLGRLAKGSVMGVDAILECFGPRIENWAKAFAKKI